MRKLIWVVIVAVVAALGYLLVKDNGTPPVMSGLNEEAATESEAATAVEEPAPIEETIEEAVTEAAGDAAAALEKAKEAVSEAVQGATDAANDAADSAMEATNDAAEATGEAAEETMDSAGDAVSDTPEALTLDGFDLDKAKEAIDNSSLGDMAKTTLKTAIETAQDSPELLQTALEKAREALGF